MAFPLSFSSSVVKFLFISLCLVFLCSTKTTKADLVEDVCSKTTIDPQYCVQTLRSDPRSASANLTILGQVAIDLGLSDTQSSVSLVKSLLQQATDPKLKSRYESCLENYNDSVDDLKDCTNDLEKKDYLGLNLRASAALDGPVTCDDNFDEPPSEPDQLKQASKHVQALCSAILEIHDNTPILVTIFRTKSKGIHKIISLGCDPRRNAASLPQLGSIAMDLAFKNATATSNKILSVIPGLKATNLRAHYVDCAEYYTDALDALREAKHYLESELYLPVLMDGSTVYTDATKCEQLSNNQQVSRPRFQMKISA